MDDDMQYDLRVYAEGVRIPAYGITRTQRVGAPLAFHVRIPPVPKAFSVLPNTTVHAFVRRKSEEEEDEGWALFAEGRVKGRQLKSSRQGNLATVLRCKGMSADWDEVSMGFEVGGEGSSLDTKKTNFFFGFSTGDEEEEPFPGFEAGRAGGFLNKFGQRGSKYLSFKTGLDRYLSKGPVQAAVSVLASMPAFSPIFRRNYSALGIENRIGYVENTRITNWLKSKEIQNLLRPRIRGFRSSTSLLDVMRYILSESFHELVPLPSPPFREQKEEKSQQEQDPEKEPERIGEGEPIETSADAPVETLYQDPRVKAYLDVIAKGEFRDAASKDDQYNALFGYGVKNERTFSDFADHPGERFPFGDSTTSAAGRYQIQEGTWRDFQNEYPEMLTDFRPEKQDKAAIAIMKEEDAIEPILKGNIKEANDRVSTRWASIPDRSGKGAYKNQEDVPFTHEQLAQHYNIRVRNHLTDGASSGSVPEGTVDGNAVRETTEVPGTLPTNIIKPTLRDAPPPVSNVVMPSDIEDLSVGESFEQSPTRLMMQRILSVAMGQGRQGPLTKTINKKKSFAPRRLEYLIRQLDDGGRLSDLQNNAGKEKIEEVENKEHDDSPVDDEELDEAWKYLKTKRERQKVEQSEKSTDMFSSVLQGETPVPENLLSLYTLDELFRGVHPAIGKFPFPKMGGENDSGAGQIEDTIIERIKKNEEVISEISPVKAKVIKKANENREDGRDKYQEAADSVTVNSIWAEYQLAMMRRQVRSCKYQGPLNLRLAVGFPIALNHPSIGWVEGTVQQIRDTINVQQNTASTSVQVSHCRFHVDYEDETWRHIEMSSDGDSSSLSDEGFPTNPIFYGEEFSADNIGDQMYQDLLQVGSVVDLATELGAEDPSPKEALETIVESYEESEYPRRWIDRHLDRPIAEEENVFSEAMGAKRDEEDWGETFPVYEVPEEGVFVESRAQWAKRFRNALQDQNYAIDASFSNDQQE